MSTLNINMFNINQHKGLMNTTTESPSKVFLLKIFQIPMVGKCKMTGQ